MTREEKVRAAFRAKLKEIVEYMWRDGALLIDGRFISEEEWAAIRGMGPGARGDGILDTLARHMADVHDHLANDGEGGH